MIQRMTRHIHQDKVMPQHFYSLAISKTYIGMCGFAVQAADNCQTGKVLEQGGNAALVIGMVMG